MRTVAVAVPDKIVIQQHEVFPDAPIECLIIGMQTDNYDEYRTLPEVLEYQDKLYGKTGWNSDQCVAYYRTDALIARKVS